MMKLKPIIYLFTFLMAPLIFINCAGSQPDDQPDASTNEEKQQQELDDIEALLGISGNDEQNTDTAQTAGTKQNEQAGAKTQNKVSGDEKLNLLSTNDVVNTNPNTGGNMTSAEKNKLDKKIKTLQQKIKSKDQTIANLRAQVTIQEDELSNRSSGSGQAMVGDISMDEYQTRYDEARSEFESRNYKMAIPLFESLLAASSTHPLAENAQYWIGECQYALRQYDAAIISFEKVFTFASPNKKDDAQFKLGLCYIRKHEMSKAREELNRLIDEYPKSEFLNQASRLLEKI